MVATAIVVPTQAHAQRVTPMSYELAPSGSKSTVNLSLENTSQTDMTIEMMAARIAVDDRGNETKTDAEDDFLIFPPQMILAAGKTQTVRVKYVGEPRIDESAAYRIAVKQVPVDIDRGGTAGVGLVVNFNTLAHVVPSGAKTELIVSNIRSNASGGWDLDVTNNGNRMARLSRTEWDVSGGGTTQSLNRNEVADMTDKNLVMPGATLTLSIPAIEGMSASSTSIIIRDIS